jgi:hypothetical protein
MFRTFTRTWWRDADRGERGYPGRVPELGEKDYSESEEFETAAEARDACKEWNDSHDEGRYSLKMEFEEI